MCCGSCAIARARRDARDRPGRLGELQRRPGPEPVAGLLTAVNRTMLRLGIEQSQANWVYSTYITPDTEAINARANQAYIDAVARYATEAAEYDTARSRRSSDANQPAEAGARDGDAGRAKRGRGTHHARVVARRRRTAAASGARIRRSRRRASTSTKVTDVMATSRDERDMREAWEGWHTDWRADAQRLPAIRRTREQGREGTRLRGHRRDVAAEVRHAGRRRSRRRWTGCGSRCVRCTSRCMPTCA